jgi:hypothetical protein
MRWIVSLALVLAVDVHAAAPTLTVLSDSGEVALELTALTVRTTIREHLARTELELTYRNTLDRQTNGTFLFPLPPDAEVSDLGLWFDGVLRHGVPVERVLARQAYDETIHRGVDPALVEWSADQRAFTLDVYPIPAKGEKKVFVAYDQELIDNDYELDVRFASKLQRFDVAIDADGRQVRNEQGVYRVSAEPSPAALTAYEPADEMWFGASSAEVRPSLGEAAPAPRVVIFYDTSASSIHQDRKRIIEFLSSFLAQQQAWGTAEFIPFHVDLEAPQVIHTMRGAQLSTTLERLIATQHAFGATNLVAVANRMRDLAGSLPPASRFVLITDGLTSLGDSRRVSEILSTLADLRRPVLVLNAAESGDPTLLEKTARATNGWSIDLTRTETESAVRQAMQLPQELSLGTEVVPARVLLSEAARIPIAMRSRDPITSIRSAAIRIVRSPIEVSMVRRAYARVRLRELLARNTSDEELLAHGKKYSQLTPRTSLLVLDSWRDYERYGIELPPDVAELKEREGRVPSQTARVPLMTWPVASVGPWFVTGRVTAPEGDALPGVLVTLADAETPVAQTYTDVAGEFRIHAPQAPANPALYATLQGFFENRRVFTSAAPSGTHFDLVLRLAVMSEAITVTAEAPLADGAQVTISSASLRTSAPTTDALLRRIEAGDSQWEDDPVAREAMAKQRHELTKQVIARLETLPSSPERLRFYLSARGVLGGDKSFHVLAAQVFRKQSPELAVRVLTDLAEAKPAHAALLRILARILEGWEEYELASLLLRRAVEIAPLELQSWRELVLLEARQGNTREVAELSVLLRSRVRAEDDDDDVLARTEEALRRWEDSSPWERKRGRDLRVPETVDLAVELMFDTSYSYVDLHVIEPGNNRVGWDCDTSSSGATHTGGYVFGYGPQIYSVETAPRGKYLVEAHYYSDDETYVGQESLAHVIVHRQGRREDFFVLMRFDEERTAVTTIEMP